MDTAKALEFLRTAADAELRANRAKFIERDHDKFMKVVRELDAMFGGDLRSGISRGAVNDTYFKEAAEAAPKLQSRTVFAVAHYKHGKSDVFRGWMGDTEVRRRGEGIVQNLYVTKQKDEFKIVSRYRVCGTCEGATTVDGEVCPECGGEGSIFRNGIEWKNLGRPLEVLKVKEPADPLSKPAYAAIEGVD